MSKETREDLRKQIEDAEKKIEQLNHQNTRLENRSRYLQRGERAKRTHHLCDMGGAIQSISPEADKLPKTKFYSLMERVFSLPEVQRLLEQMKEAD